MQQLEIVTGTTSTISKTCHNLRELNLTVMGCIEGTDVRERAGRRLESLTINLKTYLSLDMNVIYMHYAPDAESGLEGIKTYCQNLRCVNIHGRRRLNLSISNLLASYGERLQQCHVEDMNEIELKAITSACKNARFTAMVLCGSELYSTLEVLGSQLDKIYVDNREGSLDFRDCTNAWNGCVNLREIQVMNCCGKIAREIIATPKERA